MTAFGHIATRFGRKPDDREEPGRTPHRRPANARRMGHLRRAQEMLSILPEPGEAIHYLQTGYFDLLMVVPLLIRQYGKARHVRLCTLTFNGRNLTEMVRLLDSKEAERLDLICSGFFKRHNKELYADAQRELREQRGQRLVHAKNHAKVMTLDLEQAKLSIEGSANLRTNRSTEQVTVIRDDGLHDWHAAWMDSTLDANAHQDDDDG